MVTKRAWKSVDPKTGKETTDYPDQNGFLICGNMSSGPSWNEREDEPNQVDCLDSSIRVNPRNPWFEFISQAQPISIRVRMSESVW
jgi:hypothetical protein